jgi:hypothetical protein
MDIEVFTDTVERAPLCTADLNKIFYSNAQKLLRI